MRLQKYMAEAGIASRRKCEELIQAGRVKVNGQVAILGACVEPLQDLVEVDGEIEAPRPEDLPSCGCLVYGSSITQGAYTPLGSGTFPAVIGRELGVSVLAGPAEASSLGNALGQLVGLGAGSLSRLREFLI